MLKHADLVFFFLDRRQSREKKSWKPARKRLEVALLFSASPLSTCLTSKQTREINVFLSCTAGRVFNFSCGSTQPSRRSVSERFLFVDLSWIIFGDNKRILSIKEISRGFSETRKLWLEKLHVSSCEISTNWFYARVEVRTAIFGGEHLSLKTEKAFAMH